MSAHQTVLLDEAVEALVAKPDACYIDGTFGRGGHSRAILARLGDQGRLYGIDRDPAAVAEGELLQKEDARFTMLHGVFSDVDTLLPEAVKVEGILLDLGVSSPQLDQPERGFSFTHDGPLDMRMDTTRGVSASEWLSSVTEEELMRVLWDFGEERFARRMAKAVVAAAKERPIERTAQLAQIVSEANPAWEKNKHPATRAFQAIRIFINDELGELNRLLEKITGLLEDGGTLVVISFHSLEDRVVKRFMRDQSRGKVLPRRVPVTADQQLGPLMPPTKAVKPSAAEIARNPRARSAVMRVAKKRGRNGE